MVVFIFRVGYRWFEYLIGLFFGRFVGLGCEVACMLDFSGFCFGGFWVLFFWSWGFWFVVIVFLRGRDFL